MQISYRKGDCTKVHKCLVALLLGCLPLFGVSDSGSLLKKPELAEEALNLLKNRLKSKNISLMLMVIGFQNALLAKNVKLKIFIILKYI